MKNTIYHSFTVQQEDHGTRLDKLIPQQFSLYSRNYAQNLISKGNVHVNDKIALKGYIVQAGDNITITIPPAKPLESKPIPENIFVDLLYKSNDFLIINKPAGLLVHAARKEAEEFTLVDWLISTFAHLKNIGPSDRPSIIHRLDQNTSGLMIIPYTQEAYTIFGNLFQTRQINKTYLAAVHGQPDKKGIVDLPISRNPIQRNRMTYKDPTGRAAITYYQVIEYFTNATLLQLTPVTGRTHQIRVHCAAIGHPIIGDHIYGTPSKQIKRHALHSYKLKFQFKNEEYTFKADPPEDFLQLLHLLKKEK